MADYQSRVRTEQFAEYVLPNPTNWVEFEKARTATGAAHRSLCMESPDSWHHPKEDSR